MTLLLRCLDLIRTFESNYLKEPIPGNESNFPALMQRQRDLLLDIYDVLFLCHKLQAILSCRTDI